MTEAEEILNKANKWFIDFVEKNTGEGKKYRFEKDLLDVIGYSHRNYWYVKNGSRNIPLEYVVLLCQKHRVNFKKVVE